MIVIKDLRAPDTRSNEEWEIYIYNRIVKTLKASKAEGTVAIYKVDGYTDLKG